MTIRIDRFGDVTLPNYNPQIPLGTGKIKDGLVNIPGDGGYDPWGSGFAPMKPYTLRKRCTLFADTPEDLQDALDEVKGLVSIRDELYATMLHDETIERWAYARCQQVTAERRSETPSGFMQDIEIEFLINPPIWYGEYVSETLILLTGDDTFTLTNGGNRIIDDMIIEIYANAAGTITEVEVTKTAGATVYGHFIYDGTITSGAGQELIINCGAASVLNAGVDDYEHFHLQSDHRNDRWIRLNTGDNTINIKRTGGTAFDVAIVKYYYQYW